MACRAQANKKKLTPSSRVIFIVEAIFELTMGDTYASDKILYEAI
jgi:hypothetical protein